MIGKLRGRIDEIEDGALILDVGGVGYAVEVPARLAGTLQRGTETILYIQTVMREDAIRLFGFGSAEEKAWFRLLQDVQGVGAKTALALLSTLTVSEMLTAIATQDAAAVTRAHGVGQKLAKRILLELKDKAPSMPIVLTDTGPAPTARTLARADAISALVNLGYAANQAANSVDRGLSRLGEKASVEELIREGLKGLS